MKGRLHHSITPVIHSWLAERVRALGIFLKVRHVRQAVRQPDLDLCALKASLAACSLECVTLPDTLWAERDCRAPAAREFGRSCRQQAAALSACTHFDLQPHPPGGWSRPQHPLVCGWQAAGCST